MQLLLYTLEPEWQLPSLSVASIQVEAYLRMARFEFATNPCSTSSASPTGQLPALDTGDELVGGDAAVGSSEFDSARAIFDFLQQRGGNGGGALDSHLSPPQHSELLAFLALVQQRLEPATLLCTWVEEYSYTKHTRAAYGSPLPFPLNFFVPWSSRRTVAKRLGTVDGSQVYADACTVYRAVSDRLAAQGGEGYLLGDLPCSADAALYGHLLYHSVAPVSPPELRDQIAELPQLGRYLERVASSFFSIPVPTGPPLPREEWTQADRGGTNGGGTQSGGQQQTEAEKKRSRNSKLWLAGAAAIMLGYMWVSSTLILDELELLGGEYDDDDDDGGD